MTISKLIFLTAISIAFNFVSGCNNSKTNNTNTASSTDTSVNQTVNTNLIFEYKPTNKTEFKIGEVPVLTIKESQKILFDSIQIFFNKNKINTIDTLPFELKIENKPEKVGPSNLEVHIYKEGSSVEQKFPIIFLSDIEPKNYSYEIIKTYTHDRKAYTQGLVYEDGFLYEATGIEGQSTIRKVQLGSGETIQSFTISPDIFGEGITIFNDKIIQLSWQSYKGFVYDKKTFKMISQFSYTTEGWGITNDGKNLIMSDGTNRLFFLDPQSYSEIDRIEVFDNKGRVDELNELEYIDGEIYANIYRTNKIVRIDPKTGKVLAYIDLNKILPDRDYEKDTDVLNGIAYDLKGKRLFVTGKRWPKLFEIKLK